MSEEQELARQRLAEKFGDSTRTGGKGTVRRKVELAQIIQNDCQLQKIFFGDFSKNFTVQIENLCSKYIDETRPICLKKVVTKTLVTDDKKLKQAIRKFGVQPLPGIEEVCLFKDDNSIIHFSRPEVMASLPNNTFVVMGKSETKNIKELLPDIIQHLGPKQFNMLKDIMSQLAPRNSKIDEEADEDDECPELSTNFEEVSKQVE